jgi:16S rRNA (adenine1518-N6/adenine1519-N6)-dimethyltransferase
MDGNIARKIAQACVDEQHSLVVEIGAGTGALTEALIAQGLDVVAVEVDDDLIVLLREREDLRTTPLVHGDALELDYAKLVNGRPWIAAGNLPYNIATPLLLRLIETPDEPHRIVAMIQKDVADRLIARPNTPAYGSLSLAVQFRMQVRRAIKLGPGAFYPPPKVDSTVVVLDRRKSPSVEVQNPQGLLQVVRSAFAYRRKTLANSLALSLGLERSLVQQRLQELGFSSDVRGEQLNLATFAALTDALAI